MSVSTTRAERRKKSRRRPLRLVYVELAAANGGMMKDLSEEGFSLRAMMPLKVGDKTPFTLSLNESTRIEGVGEVHWVAEDGRVAGVRFLEIADSARQDIRDWLIRGDTPPEREKPVEKQEATLEQLREEMYSVPPRPEGLYPMASPENAPVAEQKQVQEEALSVAASHPESVPVGSVGVASPGPDAAERPPEHLEPPQAEKVAARWDDAAAPPLPRLSLTPRGAEPASPLSSGTTELGTEPGTKSHWKPIPDPEPPAEEAPPLPDISEILIQPGGKTTPKQIPALPPWETVEQAVTSPRRFSLSSAFTMMTLLALLAALYVFHKEVGQGLIWLGEELGGLPENRNQSLVPPSPDVGAKNGGAASPVATFPDAPADQRAPAALAPSPEKSLSTPNPVSQTTGNPDTGAAQQPAAIEPGQAEYVQATQMLRSRNPRTEMSEALRLLWIAVEKGNSNAELELAQMYWRGQGVLQNCDQAHILFTAAARKGNADAQRRLLEFRNAGCE